MQCVSAGGMGEERSNSGRGTNVPISQNIQPAVKYKNLIYTFPLY